MQAQIKAEVTYINNIGADSLRDEATALDASYDNITGSHGYFGKSIQSTNLPPALREFSQGNYVEVNPHGVVYRTHGLGSWRAGYLIVPTDSHYEPAKARKIKDGFFFVFTR